jgi:hypothetical protein
MDKVFLLHHIHRFDDDDESVKLIGVFTSEDEAKAVVSLLVQQPGFKENPDGFVLEQHLLNDYSWREGYTTVWA